MSLARLLQATKACTGVLRRDATRRHARVAPPHALRSSSRLHKKILGTMHPTAEAHVQASVPSSRSCSNRLEWSADRCCEAARVLGIDCAGALLDCADRCKCAYVTSRRKREHRELAQRLEIRARHVTIVRCCSDETMPVTWRR